ncbi:hypothetical protein M9H77_18551 [Catharanthus roseus]|uniref:Uncharacterized protein n=1 Tax=Catharanthus roseus TaxID=4058 RepID=A0ACC0B832_CATRO|nr:hypothetical protein M9H77_18551 [Catharanthus roseus]
MKQVGVKNELMKWTQAMDDVFVKAMLNQHYEDAGGIDEIDMLVEQNEVTLESFTSTQRESDEEVKNGSQSSNRTAQQEVRKKKEELREGNSMIQQYQTEEEIFKELVDIGIEKEYIEDCYLFLIQNTDKSRAFFGFPSEMGKSILSKMMAAIVNNLKSIFFGKIEADHWFLDLVLGEFLGDKIAVMQLGLQELVDRITSPAVLESKIMILRLAIFIWNCISFIHEFEILFKFFFLGSIPKCSSDEMGAVKAAG